MQQQFVTRSERPSTKSEPATKRQGRSAAGRIDAARSYRQTVMTRDHDDKRQANRRSSKDNRSLTSQRTTRPLSKRPSPVGGGRKSVQKLRAPQGARRAKQLGAADYGPTTPATTGLKGSSSKRAHSRG